MVNRILGVTLVVLTAACSGGADPSAADVNVDAALAKWERAHDALIAARADGVDLTCAGFDREKMENSFRQYATIYFGAQPGGAVEASGSYNGARRIEPEFAVGQADILEFIQLARDRSPDQSDAEATEAMRSKTKQLLAKVKELQSVERIGYVDSFDLRERLADSDVPQTPTSEELIEDVLKVCLADYEGSPGAAASYAGLAFELEETARRMNAVVDGALARERSRDDRSAVPSQRLSEARERLSRARGAAPGGRGALEVEIAGIAGLLRFYEATGAGLRRIIDVNSEGLKSYRELRESTGRMVSVEVLDKEPLQQGRATQSREVFADDFRWRDFGEDYAVQNMWVGGPSAGDSPSAQSEVDAFDLLRATDEWDKISASVTKSLSLKDVPIYIVEVADARTAGLDEAILSHRRNLKFFQGRLAEHVKECTERQVVLDRLLRVLDELRVAEQQHAAALASWD